MISIYDEDPIIIGGFPGSGTRIFCQIIEDAGIFMGNNKNKSNDAMDFVDFFETWIDVFLKNEVNNFTKKSQMEKDFKYCVTKHLSALQDKKSSWGFKTPRSILLLPFLFSQFPNMKFIYVIRDGRDIAFSKKKILKMKKHGRILLGRSIESPFDRLDLWSKINDEAVNFCESQIKLNYKIIRYEDLCNNPTKIISHIFDFIKVPSSSINLAQSRVIPPPGVIGRWTKLSSEIQNMSEFNKSILHRFDYH